MLNIKPVASDEHNFVDIPYSSDVAWLLNDRPEALAIVLVSIYWQLLLVMFVETLLSLGCATNLLLYAVLLYTWPAVCTDVQISCKV